MRKHLRYILSFVGLFSDLWSFGLMTELHELRWDPMLSVGWMIEARNQKLNPAGIQFYEDSTLQPLQNMATVNPSNSSSSAGTMEVSQNGGTSKSSISIGFSIINQQKNIHFAHFPWLWKPPKMSRTISIPGIPPWSPAGFLQKSSSGLGWLWPVTGDEGKPSEMAFTCEMLGIHCYDFNILKRLKKYVICRVILEEWWRMCFAETSPGYKHPQELSNIFNIKKPTGQPRTWCLTIETHGALINHIDGTIHMTALCGGDPVRRCLVLLNFGYPQDWKGKHRKSGWSNMGMDQYL